MNILFTTHTYSPNRDGVQFVTQYLAEGLVELGHDVTVITYMYPERTTVAREKIHGVDVVRWDARTVKTFHLGDKKGYQQYMLDNQHNYDVLVNVGTQTALTDWLFPLSEQLTIPRILYVHSIWDFKLYPHDFRQVKHLAAKLWANMRWRLYYWQHAKEFQHYALVTQLHKMDESYQFFKKQYGIDSAIIENAADDRFFAEETEDLGLGKYILNVANYMPRKNQKQCIDVFLKSQVPNDWRLVLIGSQKNAYYDELVAYEQALRTELKLGAQEKRVDILSDVPRAQISDYVKQAQVYFMASTWEAFPISLVEAMAAGVPFVSTDVGIVKYLSGGVVGRNDKELMYWLEQLAHNDALRKHYGSLGRWMAVNQFRVADKVKQLEAYLIDIVQKKEQ